MERNPAKQDKGPMRLYVGSLHFNINEEMLRGIFEPFGPINSITLMMDYETGRSKGYGFVTYEKAEDAKKAMEQMNGFELAGRPMKVGHVTDNASGGNYVQIKDGLDTEETDKTGIDLGATGRLALMAKLAEGTGMKVCIFEYLNLSLVCFLTVFFLQIFSYRMLPMLLSNPQSCLVRRRLRLLPRLLNMLLNRGNSSN